MSSLRCHRYVYLRRTTCRCSSFHEASDYGRCALLVQKVLVIDRGSEHLTARLEGLFFYFERGEAAFAVL